MTYLLLVILLLLFILSFLIFEKDIISPAFVFSLGFVVQAVFVAIYAKKWELGLHLNTFLVISLGIAEFIAVSYIVHIIFDRVRKKNKKIKEDSKNECKENSKNKIESIQINRILEILYLIFMIIVTGIYLYFIVKSVDGNFWGISNILDAMTKYDNISKFSDKAVGLPFLITNLEELVMASGYWFIYVAINNYIKDKKVNCVEILIIIVSIISSMLNGSRTTAFMMLFASATIFIIMIQRVKNENNILTLKLIKNIAILGCVFVTIFYFSAQAWGRISKDEKIYYFAIYCGAEVKNLDIFLQEKEYVKNSELWGSQTFYSIIQTLGKKVGINEFKDYKLDLPFRNINGLNLGNVYTTFYPYIYDFGYIGEFVLILIMAVICQIVYEWMKGVKLKKYPTLSILIYTNIVNCLILSFFSNKFYENIITMAMIKKIVFWITLNLIFCIINWNKILNIIEKKIAQSRKEKNT